jgi:hypothetical protein
VCCTMTTFMAILLLSHLASTLVTAMACVLLMAGKDALRRGTVRHGLIIGAVVGCTVGGVASAAVRIWCGYG